MEPWSNGFVSLSSRVSFAERCHAMQTKSLSSRARYCKAMVGLIVLLASPVTVKHPPLEELYMLLYSSSPPWLEPETSLLLSPSLIIRVNKKPSLVLPGPDSEYIHKKRARVYPHSTTHRRQVLEFLSCHSCFIYSKGSAQFVCPKDKRAVCRPTCVTYKAAQRRWLATSPRERGRGLRFLFLSRRLDRCCA